MTDEASGTQQPARAPGTSTRARTAGSRRCPTCGAQVSAHASVCPACGDGLQDRRGEIRCRHCGERSLAELSLCPYCGRELASAPPRLLTWGVPAVLVGLFLALLVQQVGASANPAAWVQDRMSIEGVPAANTTGRGLVVVVTPASSDDAALNSELEADAPGEAEQPSALDAASAPEVVSASEIVSASELAAADGADMAEQAAPPPDAESVTETGTPTEIQTGTQVPDVPVNAGQPAAGESGTDGAADLPVETEAESESVEPEPAEPGTALQAVVSAGSTSTPTPTPTSEPTPADSGPLVSAAGAARAASAGGLPTSTPTSTPTATPVSTNTPTPTRTSVATETPTPVPMPTYQIQRGDTLIVVARKNDVTVEDLMRVNGISAAEAFTIQPGQKLLIPVEGSEVVQEEAETAGPTEDPTAIVAPTQTPVPTPTTPSLRLDAPILRSPEPGTPLSCSEPGALAWLPVPFMRSDDRFVLHLGFVSGRMEDGRDIVIWVLEQPFSSSAVSWDMDGSLCSLAPQEFDRKWHWYVEVVEDVDGELRPVSPKSETWHFNWN